MERGGRQAREGRPVYAAQFPKYAKPVGSSRRVSRFPRFSPGHAILNENSILFLLVRKETRESVTWYLRSSTRAHLFLDSIFFFVTATDPRWNVGSNYGLHHGSIHRLNGAVRRYRPIYYLKRMPSHVRNNTSVKSVICISLQMYSVYQARWHAR